MRYLYLLPFGKIKEDILEKLARDLEKKFDLPVKIISAIPAPDYTYSKLRRQYDGSKILIELKRMDFPDAEKILGILSVDLYAQDLNFIFGEAETSGKVAIISLYRLNKSRQFYHRILKEAVHELGHTFGLSHCPDVKCVMHFSNVIADTDLKNDHFCQKCKKLYEMITK
jgi:archaemetzincin